MPFSIWHLDSGNFLLLFNPTYHHYLLVLESLFLKTQVKPSFNRKVMYFLLLCSLYKIVSKKKTVLTKIRDRNCTDFGISRARPGSVHSRENKAVYKSSVSLPSERGLKGTINKCCSSSSNSTFWSSHLTFDDYNRAFLEVDWFSANGSLAAIAIYS